MPRDRSHNRRPPSVDAPWVTEIRVTSLGNTKLCAGALISDRYVLTSANCISQRLPVIDVLLGSRMLGAGETNMVADISIHPEYDPVTMANDLALLRLDVPVKYIKTCCMPNSQRHADELLAQKSPLTVTGWGQSRDRTFSPTLLGQSLDYIPHNDCKPFWRRYHSGRLSQTGHLCAGKISGDPCFGDPGTPLMSLDRASQRYYLVGIQSFASSTCATGEPAVFTNIAQYLDWIINETREFGAICRNSKIQSA